MTELVGKLFDLSGKVALVTGGSKGLGKAMARGLAHAGADIVISARHEDELRAALAEITAGADVKGAYVVADLSRRDEAERLAQRALELMGRVDILVNNAGTNIPQPIYEIDDRTWDEIVELNLSSVMALTRALAPQMMQRRWGRVINISSIMGFISAPGRDVYSATKSGLLGLTRAAAIDLGPYGITVNAICPAYVRTPLVENQIQDQARTRGISPEEVVRSVMLEPAAVKRLIEPQEVAALVAYLCTEEAGVITGAALDIDLGWTAR